MEAIVQYIAEKLQLRKGIQRSTYPKNWQEAETLINDMLSSFTKDKYEVSFKHSDDEQMYITIDFEKDPGYTEIHTWGYEIFKALYDEEKFKKYNRGTDWWTSSPTRIVYKFEYK